MCQEQEDQPDQPRAKSFAAFKRKFIPFNERATAANARGGPVADQHGRMQQGNALRPPQQTGQGPGSYEYYANEAGGDSPPPTLPKHHACVRYPNPDQHGWCAVPACICAHQSIFAKTCCMLGDGHKRCRAPFSARLGVDSSCLMLIVPRSEKRLRDGQRLRHAW